METKVGKVYKLSILSLVIFEWSPSCAEGLKKDGNAESLIIRYAPE